MLVLPEHIETNSTGFGTKGTMLVRKLCLFLKLPVSTTHFSMKAWRKISHPRWDNVRLTLRHPKWRYLLQKIKRLQILVQIIFLLAYNGWNIVLFSPGCYEKRAKHLFPVFPPWLLLWQKLILAPLNLIK